MPLTDWKSPNSAAETAPEASASAEPAKMVGADGKFYTVPAASVAGALKHGWRHAGEDELAKEEKIQAGAAEAGEHSFATGIRQFANEAALGIPNLISDYNASPEEREIQQAVRARDEEANPLRSGAAKGLGLVAPMLIPGVGEVGEGVAGLIKGGAKAAEEGVAHAAEASLMRKVAASTAKVATESAIYSAPTAAVQAAYGDPDQAAETMLWGVGLGGALGAGGALLGAGLKGAAAKARTLLTREEGKLGALDNITRKNVFHITDAQAEKLGPEKLQRVMDVADREGITAANPEKHGEMIDAMRKDAGKKIGDHREALEGLLKDPEMASKVQTPGKVADQFAEKVHEALPNISDSLHAENKALADKIATRIREAGEEPTLEGLQKAKASIVDYTKAFRGSDQIKAQLGELAEGLIRKAQDDGSQALFEAGKMPEKFADYLSQKTRYETAKVLERGVSEFKGTGGLGFLKGPGLSTVQKLGFGLISGPTGLMVAGADIAREHAMKMFIKNEHGLLGKSVSFLKKIAADPSTAPLIGGFMAKEGVTGLQAHLADLPHYLSGSKLVARASADAATHLIGPTTGLSKQQQYDKLTDTLHQAAADPNQTAQNVGALASTFSGTDPQLASLVAQKKLAAVAWLNSQIPRGPAPKPFIRDEWKASPTQQKEFLAKAEIVHNPMVVWEHFQKGALSKLDRDTLMAVYPTTYKAMCQKLHEIAFDPRAPMLDHAKRNQILSFMGQPTEHLADIQQALNSPPPSQGQSGGSGGAPKPSSRPKFKAPSLATDSTRRTYGGSVA